jgi:hypothetical protein
MTGSARRTTLALAVGVVVAAAVVAGFLVMGSPGEVRLRRLDERRVGHIRQIARSVALFWTVNDHLPESLGQLSEVGGVAETPSDPESGAPYSYRVIDSVRYELCAEFARRTEGLALRPAEQLWSHGQGRQCFELVPAETER